MPNVKALVLLSGGMDSMLAARVLMDLGIAVSGVCFISNFFNADKARTAAKNLGIELKVVDLRDEILALVKNPPSGYGKNLNPCVDCHALMIKTAGKIAKSEGFDFVATGEVLGQRPFSQNRNSLDKVRMLSGVEILRPLSAKLLDETEAEKSGLVRRGRLLDIEGRTRERQMELAKKYGLKEYPSPAGGCLLTDPGMSERLGKMLDYWPECTTEDAEILKFGRVFWLEEKGGGEVLVIIGRHAEDNAALEKLRQKGDYFLELIDINGPVALLRGLSEIETADLKIAVPEKLAMGELKLGEKKSGEEILKIAALLTGYYAVKARGKEVGVKIVRI
jgi:tRNA-uridine 2-sulfurtransferase